MLQDYLNQLLIVALLKLIILKINIKSINCKDFIINHL